MDLIFYYKIVIRFQQSIEMCTFILDLDLVKHLADESTESFQKQRL